MAHPHQATSRHPAPGLFAVARSGRSHHVTIDTRLTVVLAVGFIVVGMWSLATAAYLLFRDDVLSVLMLRQREMQFAYEDRIASLRSNIDRLTSRQLVDQNTFEGKVEELLARQAQLETRHAIVAALASQADSLPRAQGSPGSAPRLTASPQAAPLTIPRDQGGPALGDGVSAFSPIESKPRPLDEAPPLLRGAGSPDKPAAPVHAPRSGVPRADMMRGAPVQAQLGMLASSLGRHEAEQLSLLAAFERDARQVQSRYSGVLAELGLEKMKPPANDPVAGQGGPFVPIRVDPNDGPFEGQVNRLQTVLLEVDRLKRVVDTVPLRRPLRGDVDTTSGFGYRVDPFTRGMAMHTGIDFRDEFGAPVRVTAPGKVVTAEWTGGYGNMVEVDHGNGLSTRYAHLSAILVTEGQRVETGAIVGKLGSTGRSTGPHLHYETRVDGEAVDPIRYLRAGQKYGPW